MIEIAYPASITAIISMMIGILVYVVYIDDRLINDCQSSGGAVLYIHGQIDCMENNH